jgi:carboxyl-terminal processing protease
MKSTRIRLAIIILISLLIGYYAGVSKVSLDWHNFSPDIQISSKEPPASLQFGDANKMWDVLGKIESTYYDRSAINVDKLLNGAIAGMVSSLDDPYTLYLPAQQNNDFKQGLAGQFQGIGAELGMKGKDIIVVAPLDGSPASKAGIKPGDSIIKVDDQSVSGLNINQVVAKIRGQKGTPVVLNVLHKGNDKTVDVKIVRDTIQVKSLLTWTKKIKDIEGINKKDDGLAQAGDSKIVYIRLSQFGDNTNNEWQKIASSVAKQLADDSSINGIVFDLRNNPGGYLNDAVYIGSEFIKDGAVVQQEDKNGQRIPFPVTGKGLLVDVPVVVLINKGSASASEIVAGALRDHERATLVGETSFGKGTVQQAEDLGAGSGLHVTIAKWLTPNGTWVGNGKNGTGLTPDIAVSLDTKDSSHDVQLEKAVEQLVK